MGANSSIEWTTHTFNPWWGCTKVSQGCKHCYAETLSNRFDKDVWGPGKDRRRTSAANWKEPLKWQRQAEKGTTYEERHPRVFCASMADVFEDNAQLNPWRLELFNLIQQTPNLQWLLLTKRPENIGKSVGTAVQSSIPWSQFRTDMEPTEHENDTLAAWGTGWMLNRNPPENVWLGTSIESQDVIHRIDALRKVPAKIRFLSIEPLIGPVNLDGKLDGIHWVIVGGESGHNARPMRPEWAREIVKQCTAENVAVFVKQMGGVHDKRGQLDQIPEDLRIRQFPDTAPVNSRPILPGDAERAQEAIERVSGIGGVKLAGRE